MTTELETVETSSSKLWEYASAIVFMAGMALSIGATLVTPTPIGADYYFHLQMAEEWMTGSFAMFGELAMRVNHYPYFSILHFMLIPTVLMGNPYGFAKILQVTFYTLSLGLTMMLAQRRGGPKAATVTGMILLGCLSFTDAAIQVRPQSLAMVLYPLALGFYISNQKGGFAASVISLVYTHGIAALSLVYSLLAVKLRDSDWRKTILVTAIAISPILLVSLAYFGGAYQKWSGIDASSQEHIFWKNPLVLTPLFSGATLLAVPILGYAAATWKKQSNYAKMLVISVLGSLPMLPMWPDRWLQYISIPFALLIADWTVNRKKIENAIVLPIILALFLIYQANYWYVTLSGGWFVPNLPIHFVY